MSQELEKGMRMISDLVYYCYLEGAGEFDMRLKRGKGNTTEMTLSCPLAGLDPEKLDSIRRTLQAPRQREVEQNFWELSGEMELGGELALAGVMSDRAEIIYNEDRLTIRLYRGDPKL